MFINLFEEIIGQRLNEERFEQVYLLAVDENETIKQVITEMNWELEAF